MIDICAVGPLRVSNALYNAGKITKGGKIAMVTSQGGSVTWREVQNPSGGDYGHHMSKAAANMGAKLLAQELKHEGIMVQVLHPGFNKTDMTAKYAKIWEVEGAVDPAVGAKRVLHEISLMTPEHNGHVHQLRGRLTNPVVSDRDVAFVNSSSFFLITTMIS